MCENGSNPSFDRQKLINLPFLNVASVCLEDREREREKDIAQSFTDVRDEI